MKSPIRLAAVALAAVTLLPARGSVVINEIFYRAPDDIPDLEWVELHNTGGEPVDVSRWRFDKGIDFAFGDGSTIEPHGFVVLCSDLGRFLEYYDVSVAGQFSGRLNNGGETLRLVDAGGGVMDEVTYSDSPPWPLSPDGETASLERIVPTGPGDLARNWAPSAPHPTDLQPAGTPGARNSSHAEVLPPMLSVAHGPVVAGEPVSVRVHGSEDDEFETVEVAFRLVRPGHLGEETCIPLARNDRHYEGSIPAQEGGAIVRYRIRTVDEAGHEAFHPHPNALRPAVSYYVPGDAPDGALPLAFIVNTDAGDVEALRSQLRGMQSSEDEDRVDMRGRFMAFQQVDSLLGFSAGWFAVSAAEDLPEDVYLAALAVLRKADEERIRLLGEILAGGHERIAEKAGAIRTALEREFRGVLSEEQTRTLLSATLPDFGWRDPRRAIVGQLPVENDWLTLTRHFEPRGARFRSLRNAVRQARADRDRILEGHDGGSSPDNEEVSAAVKDYREALGVRARRHLVAIERSQGSFIRPNLAGYSPRPPRGRSAFVVVNPGDGEVRLFDFVDVSTRSAGFKVRFHGDQTYDGMTTANIIFEVSDRFALAEALAFDVYRRAGSPACRTEFVRLELDGNPAGYHLLFEHINGSFLRNNDLDPDGDLYKLIWYGAGVEGMHERKGDPDGGHKALVRLIDRLNEVEGEEQWEFIQKNFDVGQVATYFAVNTVLSYWDGFFNNYFAYREPETGRWMMFPWDQDKTWGFYDSLPDGEDFFEMPLTFGMNGDPRPTRGGGFAGSWWRPGGVFSGPLLANPEFREVFLKETRRILEEIYNEDVYFPVIDELAERLRPEIPIRARIIGEPEEVALERFEANIASLKRHLVKRSQFLLEQEELSDL